MADLRHVLCICKCQRHWGAGGGCLLLLCSLTLLGKWVKPAMPL